MRHIGNVQVSGSFKQQGSDDNVFSGDLRIADTILYASGSTKFGNDITDNHAFTGTVDFGDPLELDSTVTVYGNMAVNGIFDVFGTFNDNSSQITKTNISDISANYDVSQIVDSLRPVSYTDIKSGDTELGFIAEEVDLVSPILSAEKNGEIWGIKPLFFIPILVKEIQNLRQRVAQLESGSL